MLNKRISLPEDPALSVGCRPFFKCKSIYIYCILPKPIFKVRKIDVQFNIQWLFYFWKVSVTITSQSMTVRNYPFLPKTLQTFDERHKRLWTLWDGNVSKIKESLQLVFENWSTPVLKAGCSDKIHFFSEKVIVTN